MPAKTSGKQNKGFKPGTSGNPSGRPVGSRNKATLAIEALLDGQAEGLTQKAIELALEGDLGALRLCLERICPPRKDRPVSLHLPDVQTASDCVQVMAELLKAVGAGDITPEEAPKLSTLIEIQRKTLETQELEQRISDLEKGKGEHYAIASPYQET
ncbi:MAG: hypothetical protein HWE30_13775 [Methylocystaceae bacterium]|nr:hypothetical protein [Methylocystaceae bacterium]